MNFFSILEKEEKQPNMWIKKRLDFWLRISVSLCFIGHGAWGVIGKDQWVLYFNVVGIRDSLATILMPMVGVVDILIGIIFLFYLIQIGLCYFIWQGWAFWTALLRPLAGESFWEVWERAGNYFPPILFLILTGAFTFSFKDFFSKLKTNFSLSLDKINNLEWPLLHINA